MSIINNVGSFQPLTYAYRSGSSGPSVQQSFSSPSGSDTDSVELSSLGQTLAELAVDSSFRVARIQAIQSEILAGTYETPERIAGTVSRLLDFLA